MIVDKNNYSIECFTNSQIIDGEYKSNGIERKRHLYQILPYAKLDGHIIEFGVYKGKTISIIASVWQDQTIWGFDSFVGLPEDWRTNSQDALHSHPAGHFDLRNDPKKPTYPTNANLVAGWFNESLPSWIEQNPGPIKFLHIDCDLYSSTLTVLELLNSQIVPGTVIAFDEMYPWNGLKHYDLWEQGEYQALKEWTSKFTRKFKTLFRNRYQQCSIEIVS